MAAVVEDLRLRGEERFVGVQHLGADEPGQMRDRGHEHHDSHEAPTREPLRYGQRS